MGAPALAAPQPATARERVRFHRLRRGGAAAAGGGSPLDPRSLALPRDGGDQTAQGQWLSNSGHGATRTDLGQYRSRRPENVSYPKNTLLGRAGQTTAPG